MAPRDLQLLLSFLGHYDGPFDGQPVPEAVKRFQRHVGLTADGIAGPKTYARLAPLEAALKVAPEKLVRAAPWRMTSYHIAEQIRTGQVPMVDTHGRILGMVDSSFFAEAALEGTARLIGGKLVNVDQWVKALRPVEYASVAGWYLSYVKGQTDAGKTPKPSGYFGIQMTGNVVTSVMAFREIQDAGVGYGKEKLGIAKVPFKTLAADLIPKPVKWQKHVGLVAPGTEVFILEWVGRKFPGGLHDGWFTVNDCGGGIYGSHFDEFVGTKGLEKTYPIIERAHIWWKGIEAKVPVGYDLGLWS